MAYGLIQQTVAAGYEQGFVESFMFHAFDEFDPYEIELVSTMPENAFLTT